MSKRTAKVVGYILAHNQLARDSDNELIIECLQLEGANLNEWQKNVIRKLTFESITRCRRKLQEEGKYMPSDPVAKRRRLKSLIVQQNIPTTPGMKVPALIEQQPRHPNYEHGLRNPR